MADNIGKAYVTIIPKAEGISDSISQLITPAATTAGQSAGRSIASGIGGGIQTAGGIVTKFAATSASTIAGITSSVAGKVFRGGMTRAIGIDDAMAKFKQLGFNAEDMKSSVLDAVRGTRYGLDEAATVAVNFASTGIKAGTEMTTALQSVASAASISGVDLGHMGAIYTKVASAGKLTGAVMTQLSYNGINASSALEKSLGKTSDEIADMVKKGQIDFKMFSKAMKDYFGDAADSANSTFSGAAANVRAALSRMGAEFVGPAMENLRLIFAGGGKIAADNGLIGTIDRIVTAMGPLIEKFKEAANMVGQTVATRLSIFNQQMDKGKSVVEAAADALFYFKGPLSGIREWFESLSPTMQTVVAGVAKVGAAIAGVAAGMGVLSGAVGALIPSFGGLFGPIMGAGSAFRLVSNAGNTLFGSISALVGGGGLPALASQGGMLGSVFRVLTGPIGIAVGVLTAAFTQSEALRKAVMDVVTTVGSSLVPILQSVFSVVQPLMPVISTLAEIIGNVLAPVIEMLLPLIEGALTLVQTVVEVATGLLIKALEAVAPQLETLSEKVTEVMDRVKEAVIPVVRKIVAAVGPLLNKVLAVVIAVMAAIFSKVNSVLTKTKAVFQKVWGAVGPIVSKAANGIKKVIDGLRPIVAKVKSVFQRAKEAITGPIEAARDKVKGIIDKIKGFFNFSVPTPHIPLPYFSISPAGWKIGDLVKGKIPRLSVGWHRKAEEQPYMFQRATLIGAGEHRDEILYGRAKLMNDIKKAVGGGGQTIYNTFNQLPGEDPEAYAIRVARQFNREIRMA